MASDLRFPPTHEPKGFSTDATARRDGSPEPVVRELLQNSLDAAKDASKATPNDPAEVVFTINESPWALIPGSDSYRRAFNLAVQERKRRQGEKLGIDEERVIQRIQDVLDADNVRILYCRDNGIGINDMERVLFEGNTSKPSSGGGSIVVGHMTAFSASDLRYVLYAGVASASARVVGGHAILAAHVSAGVLHSSDGYYTSDGDLFSYDPNNSSRYHADEIPPLLEQELRQIVDIGSLVCITGFNDFRADEEAVSAICRVAAINFIAAIQRREFNIEVTDGAGNSKRVDSTTIGEILKQHSSQQRAQSRGWLAGGRAFRAWETLSDGLRLDIEGIDRNEAEVWFRSLPDNSNSRTQVNIFRDGMWITFDAPGLTYAHFTNASPFDCVVLLHRGGRLYNLVRSAEGPEHCGLENYRALKWSEKQEIKECFTRIADCLRKEAGQPHGEEYVPPGFAVVPSDAPRDATVVPPYRPRMPEGEGSEPNPQPGLGPNPGPGPEPGPGPRRRRGPQPRTRTSPRPGTAAAVRRAFKPLVNQRGEANSLALVWEPHESITGSMAVRVKVVSGSDQTCEQPFTPEWLDITGIEHDGVFYPAEEDKKEVTLPALRGSGIIRLAHSRPDSSGIEPDLVMRSTRLQKGSE